MCGAYTRDQQERYVHLRCGPGVTPARPCCPAVCGEVVGRAGDQPRREAGPGCGRPGHGLPDCRGPAPGFPPPQRRLRPGRTEVLLVVTPALVTSLQGYSAAKRRQLTDLTTGAQTGEGFKSLAAPGGRKRCLPRTASQTASLLRGWTNAPVRRTRTMDAAGRTYGATNLRQRAPERTRRNNACSAPR